MRSNIVQYSGLQADFIVLGNKELKAAIAYIKNKKRYVAHNPDFIASIVDSSDTDRAAISILAHEIAHQLIGHTLNPTKVSLGYKPACDKYSGFIFGIWPQVSERALCPCRLQATLPNEDPSSCCSFTGDQTRMVTAR